jgi:hypothetical protein
MQPRKWEVRLRLNPGGGEHSHTPAAGRLGGVSQQTGLADPRLTAKHERLAVRAYLVQEGRQELLFLEATD